MPNVLLFFFACDNKSEDPIPTPDPDPEPVIKTPVAVPDAEFEAFLIRQGIDKDKEYLLFTYSQINIPVSLYAIGE